MRSLKISFSNNKIIHAEPGKTILESAKNSGLILENSCNDGRCGICACTLIDGKVTQLNDSFHSENERIGGKILTCQAIPISDIKVDIEDLGEYSKYPTKTIPVRISEKSEIANGILKLTFRTPSTNKLSFLSGQYINLINNSIRRSYSIANAERLDGTIDIIVKKVHQGIMSDILFNSAKQNDLFRIEGPLGTFGWRNTEKKNLVFLATGTGIAPIISILEGNKLEYFNIFVIWGNRHEEEFFDLPEIFESFSLTKVLSKDLVEGFEKGHVQDALLSMQLELSNTVVYACGSDSMIRESQSLLVAMGLDQSDFYYDSFLSSGS